MNILNKITKNNLKLNKKRTIVTIIGIIIAGAMITAVSTLAVTFQSFMIKAETAEDGAWEAKFLNVKTSDANKILNDARFEKKMLMVPVGLAQNQYSDDEFIYIKGYTKESLDNMRIKLIEGKLPENDSQIALSKSFFDGKENEPKIGGKITLKFGKRISIDGYELIKEKKEENEKFEYIEEKTYTVCGKIERPDFENTSTYYTAGITYWNENATITAQSVDIGVIDKKSENIYSDTEDILKQMGVLKVEDSNNIKYNTYVLAYKGVNKSGGFNTMLYSVCGILILVIAIGSILVIYNSFAISVSERKKQFGMLASIGATKKQIKKSVIFEGAVLGSIGIPLGILSGIGGIWVTLKAVNTLLEPIFKSAGYNVSLELMVSWQSILIAIVLIALTIYLSVIIPAKKASKITPIEAIRGNNEVKVKAKKLRTPKFIRKMFGIEGEIALKNLKRSKKRYRTTVISLIISIVLFVSVSGFVGYLYSGFDSLYATTEYDYQINLCNESDNENKTKELAKKIEELKTIDKVSVINSEYLSFGLSKEKMNSRFLKEMDDNKNLNQMFELVEGEYPITCQIVSLNDTEYNRYLQEIGVDKLDNNQAILVDYVNMLQTAQIEGNLTNYKAGEKIDIKTLQENGESKNNSIEIKKVSPKLPFGIDAKMYPVIVLILNSENNIQMANNTRGIFVNANDEKEFNTQIENIKKENNDFSINSYNIKEQIQQQRNLKLIIQIFLYGFITLISLVGIANIFNTISTNINLRRREFAMLKSIGMTDKGFKRMLDLECFFYGTKALLYGLPIGIGICYLINRGFGNLIEFTFSLPWFSIIISIIAVYVVVFITMLYASSKVKKENIIDTLRDENV